MTDKPKPQRPVSRPIGIDVKTNPRDLDRSRAEFAWNSVSSVKKNQPENHQKKYGSLARKMPTLIQVNGLAQTMAFLRAGEAYHIQMVNHLSTWFCARFHWNIDNFDLLQKILNMDSQQYRLVTSEALAFLQWIKRFAEADLGEE
jgi:CRISPR-associated protein Cmr5